MEQIIFDNIRVQLLSEHAVRIELKKKGKFCDKNTFFIPDRTQYTDKIAYSVESGAVCFGEYRLYIPENAKSLAGVRLDKNGENIYRYKKIKNSGELPTLDKTPEVFALSDTPRIIIPEGGYSVKRKGEYKVEENVQDIYLLLCKKDAKLLRKIYVELTGKPELVRLSTLGGWNSKYYAYTEDEAKQLILDYEEHNVPLDVMVIDTDWRSCENGWGYDINTKLFPDMKRFFDFAHSHGVEVMFNDHPEPVDGANVFAPEEIAYRESNLQSLMEKGLDIWWYDRNWGIKLVSPSLGVPYETMGLYLFEDVTRHHFQKQSGNKEVYRRPVIMGNAVDVSTGSYLGVKDSASHRYSIQWTGDIGSEAGVISQEVENIIKCGNNAIPYLNSDCGGHIGNPDKELFIRWMQYGTLSPVFRPHCTNNVERTREPWAYDSETLDIVREYNNLRYRLLPVIYKSAYESYEYGLPLFKALGWEYPSDKRALKCNGAYMLGKDILISPMGGNRPWAINKNCYARKVKATYYNGRELKGEPIAAAEYKVLDMVLNHTSPEKGVPVYDFSARFETVLKFDSEVELYIRCDDGATVWIDGEKVLEDKTLHAAWIFDLKRLEPQKEYKIEIEYFQAGGEACCELLAKKIAEHTDAYQTYLPAGKWLDAFSGKIYAGVKTVKRNYGLGETPLFVRLGALIPLAYEAKNTKRQKWDKLVYDFYPCKDASDKGYLYEDDTETTAYKLGQFRKSAYEAYYCQEENAFVVKLHAGEGGFDGEKCFDSRKISIKYHLLNGADSVKKITVNGEDHGYMKVRKDGFAFPLNADKTAQDSSVIIVSLETTVSEEYEIKFYL